ncbi:MAG: hypothetical protein ABID40_01705 [Candidatus Bipolaricaulota bacterium]
MKKFLLFPLLLALLCASVCAQQTIPASSINWRYDATASTDQQDWEFRLPITDADSHDIRFFGSGVQFFTLHMTGNGAGSVDPANSWVRIKYSATTRDVYFALVGGVHTWYVEDNAAGAGDDLLIRAGSAGLAGTDGGDARFSGGAGVTGIGAADGSDSGDVYLQVAVPGDSGSGTAGSAGDIHIQGTDGGNTAGGLAGQGSHVSISGGDGGDDGGGGLPGAAGDIVMGGGNGGNGDVASDGGGVNANGGTGGTAAGAASPGGVGGTSFMTGGQGGQGGPAGLGGDGGGAQLRGGDGGAGDAGLGGASGGIGGGVWAASGDGVDGTQAGVNGSASGAITFQPGIPGNATGIGSSAGSAGNIYLTGTDGGNATVNASAGTGTSLYIYSGGGGTAANGTGGTGGLIESYAGTGGAAPDGGPGGAINYYGGDGGNGTAGSGGAGGGINFIGGTGGAGTGNPGGAGGDALLTGGDAGASGAGGADGGTATHSGGAASGNGTGGDGDLYGGASAGPAGTAGAIHIDAGAPNGGARGDIEIGVTNVSTVRVGHGAAALEFYSTYLCMEQQTIYSAANGLLVGTYNAPTQFRQSSFQIEEEFWGRALDTTDRWLVGNSAVGGETDFAVTANAEYGQINANVVANAGSAVWITMDQANGAIFDIGNGAIVMEVRLQLPVNTDGDLAIGFGDANVEQANPAPGTYGYIQFDAALAPDWHILGDGVGGGAVDYDTGQLANIGWQVLRAQLSGSGSLEFFVDGLLIGNQNNIVSAGTVMTFFLVYRSTGNARQIDVDFIRVWQARTY